MSVTGWKYGRRWRHLTLNAKKSCNMHMTLKRLLNTMQAMKKSVVVYAGIDKSHIHLLMRGIYLHQRCWSEIFKVCSNGSYIAYVVDIKDELHYGRVLVYIKEQSQTERFINWPSGVPLVEFL